MMCKDCDLRQLCEGLYTIKDYWVSSENCYKDIIGCTYGETPGHALDGHLIRGNRMTYDELIEKYF